MIYLKSYWVSTVSNGPRELEFKQVQVQDRGWIISDKGLPFTKAEKLIEYWNMTGNKNGYYYHLHKPENI